MTPAEVRLWARGQVAHKPVTFDDDLVLRLRKAMGYDRREVERPDRKAA